MIKKIENLKDLFLERARELYDTSLLEQKELAKIKERADNQQLAKIIEREIESAKNQAGVLIEILSSINERHTGGRDLCARAIFEEAHELISKCEDQKVTEAAIVESIQRLNHNNIVSLGTLAAFAKELGMISFALSLKESLSEEKSTDRNLSELATTQVNKEAAILV